MKYFLRGVFLLLFFSSASWVHAETNVYFSPNGGCQEQVLTAINKAHESIDVAMYSFSSREIAQALAKAKERGLKVRVIFDVSQVKDSYSKSRYLSGKGLNVKYHMGPGLMHDKFAVIDDKEVLTGSFNWTVSADKKNAENLLVITDRGLAHKYAKQFKHLWAQSGEDALAQIKGAHR